MPVEFVGEYEPIQRVVTGLYTLDRALADKSSIGIPLRSLYELYGYEHCGKSTLAYFLSGKIRPEGRVYIADFELLDREYLVRVLETAGFEGAVELVGGWNNKKKRPAFHSEALSDLAAQLREEDTSAVVFDSVTSFASMPEEKEDQLGQSFVGKRAFYVGQFARKAVSRLVQYNPPKAAFVINHSYQVIGSRGSTTAGGQVLKAVAGVRIKIRRREQGFIEDKDHYLARGVVEKLRYGGKGREFNLFYIEGQGIHPGMTALFDCVELGIATRGNTVKIGDKSCGYLNADLVTAAEAGDEKPFRPFYKALEEMKDVD